MTHLTAFVRRQVHLVERHLRFTPVVRGRSRDAKIDALVCLYHAANDMLYDLGVDYWLDFGTLLGYYREGGILKHDNDVDFGAPEKAFDAVWEARHRLPAGFTMHDTSHRHHGPKLYIGYHGLDADIYFYRDTHRILQSYEKSRYVNDTQPLPKALVYPLRQDAFLDRPTRLPCDVRGYLTHRYRYLGADGVRDPKTGYWSPP